MCVCVCVCVYVCAAQHMEIATWNDAHIRKLYVPDVIQNNSWQSVLEMHGFSICAAVPIGKGYWIVFMSVDC